MFKKAVFLCLLFFSSVALIAPIEETYVSNEVSKDTVQRLSMNTMTENYEEVIFYETTFSGVYTVHGSKINIDFTFSSLESESVIFKHQGSGYHSQIGSGITISSNDGFSFEFTPTQLGIHQIDLEFIYQNYIAPFTITIKSTESIDYITANNDIGIKQQEFMYLYDQELIELDAYNSYVYGEDEEVYEVEEEIPDGWFFSGGWMTVNGTITWKDKNGVSYPARNMEIQIWDDNALIDSYLTTTYTNDNGYFEKEVYNDTSFWENGYDIYIKVVLRNDDFEVWDTIFVYNYRVKKTYKDCVNGWTYTINHEFDTANGNKLNEAVSIFQATTYGTEYMDSLDAYTPYFTIHYPGWFSTYYNFVFWTISIEREYYDDWYTILHEFGHYAAHYSSITDYWPAKHLINQNQINEHGKWIGTMLSWSEGFAHYFSMAIIENTALASNGMQGVERLKMDNYTSRNIETSSASLDGEGTEWVIARLLWDIADGKNEAHDSVELGHDGLWDILNKPSRILPLHGLTDFIKLLNLDESDENYGKLLSYYNIAPTLVSPSNNSNSTYNVPLFEWNAGGGTGNTNNDFILYIKDENGNTLLSKSVGNNTSYQLTESEWTNLLNTTTSYFKWNVRTRQTSWPVTGPYYSETFILNRPLTTTINVGQTLNGYLNIGDYYWYKFVAPSNNNYTFYTTGSSDTYGEFFYQPVVGQSTNGRFDYNDDGGDGNNFSKILTLTKNSVIYIRVRGYAWNRTGNFTFSVSVPAHSHSYGHYYTSNGRMNHRSYCSCGEYIIELHNWIMIPYNDGYHTGLQQYCPDCGEYGLVMLMSSLPIDQHHHSNNIPSVNIEDSLANDNYIVNNNGYDLSNFNHLTLYQNRKKSKYL